MVGGSRVSRLRCRMFRAASSAFKALVWDAVYPPALLEREIALEDGSIIRGYSVKRSIERAILASSFVVTENWLVGCFVCCGRGGLLYSRC